MNNFFAGAEVITVFSLQDALEELEFFKYVIGLHIDKINELIKESTEL